ncbi:AAA family ATPase [Spirulina sp. CS-785/01]|uniref:AAA family ATPase n=1 Tax=Spirulina sp. CS-785/01 TaxID=3021716 RepID=UPI00232F3A67|nr:AAA family ATPase [Spirulina sp. CS-785/01]MDB9312313.1 AAA family ATPase [Spirulina sp. CS-785/01]
MSSRPIQKILFGSPGTGKSHRLMYKIIPQKLGITDDYNIVPTIFHPEYTYGDFMGKLMPFTDEEEKVSYKYYPGHFLKALGKAYENIISSQLDYEDKKKNTLSKYKKEIDETRQDKFTTIQKQELEQRYNLINKPKPENVVLVIDELNRGNSAAIFGSVFQLLDRDNTGWSEYTILLSDLEKQSLLKQIGLTTYPRKDTKKYEYKGKNIEQTEYNKYLNFISDYDESENNNKINLEQGKIKIPPNFSILATMNTSDNSIYFMDSAFKRRWDWEFVNIQDDNQRNVVSDRKIRLYNIDDVTYEDTYEWNNFVDNLNKFILSNYKTVRKIEDKQIGYFFINEEIITEEHIKNKLMFFIWDSVFRNNRKPLIELLQVDERDLVTFGQFTQKELVIKFVKKIMDYNTVDV